MHNESYASPVLTANAATASGGAALNQSTCLPALTNCALVANTAASASTLCQSGTTTLTNCTLTRNATTIGGGLYYDATSGGTVRNCLLWNDTGSGAANQREVYKAGPDSGGLAAMRMA